MSNKDNHLHTTIKKKTDPAKVPHLLGRLFATFTGRNARKGYLAAADQGVISLSNFLATIIIARSVSATELGVYGVGFIATRLVRSIQEGLVVQPLNVFGAGMDKAAFKRYATSSSLLQLLIALILSITAGLGGWILTSLGNDTAGPALFSLWFVFLFWQMQEFLRRLLYTRGYILSALINSVLANVLRVGLLLFWAADNKLSGTVGLAAIGWGALFAIPFGVWAARSCWTSQPMKFIKTCRKNWGFGRWVLGGTIANWVAVEFYPVLTAGMISFAAAGAYRALQTLVAPIHLLLRAVDTFFTPHSARIYQLNGKRSLSRTMRLIYITAGIPTLALLAVAIAFPKPLLRLLYGETYLGFSSGILPMAVLYALMYAYWPLQTALKAARLSRPIFSAYTAAMLAMFTIGIWGVRQWGVYGTIAGQGLNALVIFIVLAVSWKIFSRRN